jgi:hypothetical protein
MNHHGRSLELYFIDGRPDGMLTAEVFNWTGHVLVAPRTQITQALRRQEANYTGIYLLLGDKEGEPTAYIGEGEDIADRIRNHDSRKSWWTKAIMVTTGANNLNKAHVKYLEARLVEEALSVRRIALDNGVSPSRPGLSEAAKANMEGFLNYLFIVLPAIGVDMFVSRTRESTAAAVEGESPIFEMTLKKVGLVAQAKLENGEFVVQAGSLARGEWVGQGAQQSYRRQFEELVRAGILVQQGDHRVFSSNYAFGSPSAAGAIVSGRSCNGQLYWINKDTRETYFDWEQRQMNSIPAETALRP